MMGPAMPNLTEPEPPERTDRPTTSRRHPPGARWVGYGAIAGAALALMVSTVLTAQGISLPGDPGSGESERAAFSAPPGSCLDWTTADAGDARTVDCAGKHLFEVIGTVDLTTTYGPAAAFPTDQAWHSVVQKQCTPLADEYLAGRFDPFGRFAVGALKPSQPGWRAGDRKLHCGLQVNARSGALFHVVSSAKGTDQSNVHEPGTCLGIDGVDVGDPVDCAQPHAVEVVGNVDLGILMPAAEYPPEPKQDDVLAGACTKLADEYAGKPGLVAEKKLTVYWDSLKQESWEAGTRKVDCKLGALLPDKSGFAPITGGVRGAVQIGAAPAPPAEVTATPGAPIDLPPLTLPTTPSANTPPNPPPSGAPPGAGAPAPSEQGR
jgi:putative regulator of septum formation